MKKRIISLLMALVMTVSLLPTAVWAAEASPRSGSQAGTDDTVYPVNSDVAVQTIGANANAVENAVTELIDAHDNVIGQYATIAEAIMAAEDGCTVKLIEHGATYTLESNENFPIRIEYDSITLDLNGCTLKRSVSESQHGILEVSYNGKVILRNGTLDLDDSASEYGPAQAIEMPSGYSPELTLENMTIKVADIDAAEDEFSRTAKGYAIRAEDGTLNIKSGTYGKIYINNYNSARAQLSGGSYESVMCNKDNTYAELLEKGYIFAKQDGSYVDPSTMENVSDNENIKNIQVIPCTHKDGDANLFVDGTCSRCGLTCTKHTYEMGKCGTCGQVIVANDDSRNYYVSLSEALEQVADGGTVNLMENLSQDALTYNYDKSVTLDDLSGQHLQSNGTDATLTVSGGKLTIAASYNQDYPPTIINNGKGFAVSVTGGTLAFGGKATLTGGLQVIGGGKLEGGLKEGSILIAGTGNAMDGGSASSVSVRDSVNNQNYGVVLDLLGEGLAFAKYDKSNQTTGDIVSGNEPNLTEDVIVVPCTHKGAGGASLFEDGECTACGLICEHETVVNNTCSVCEAEMWAQDGTGKYYLDLAEALEGIADGGTVTMLATPPHDYDVIGFCYNADGNLVDKTVTLVMDGHSLSVEGIPALVIESGKLSISDDAVISQTEQVAQPAVFVDNAEQDKDRGTLEFKGKATLTGGLYIQNWGKLVGGLKEGSVITSNGTYSVSVEHSIDTYKTVLELLADGCAFAKYDKDTKTTGDIIPANVSALTEDVIVVECTHKSGDTSLFENGTCKGCGFTCDAHDFANGVCKNCGYACLHEHVTETGLEGHKTAACDTCGQQMAVKVASGGKTTYYAQAHYTDKGVVYDNTLKTLLNDDAITPDGCTVTLLADDLNAWAHVDDGKNIKLDLNGKNLMETSNGILVGTGSKLTVTGEGSSSENDQQNLPCVFNVQGGTLVFDDSFGGTFNLIRVESGTLTSTREEKDSINIGTLQINGSNAKISFKQGTFGKIATQMRNVSVTLGDLLGMWQDADGNDVRSGNAFQYTTGDKAFVRYDTVIDINNPVENVKTAACHHDSLHGDNICDYCGWERLVAIYTTSSGTVGTMTPAAAWTPDAINEAANTAFNTWNSFGGTLKLFVDFALEDKTYSYAADVNAIDLNGHTITGGTLTLAGRKNVTITDSSVGKTGSFANVTVNGGASLTVESGVSVGKITVADKTAKVTLEEGAKLKGYKIPSGMILADWLEDGCYLWDGGQYLPEIIDGSGIEGTSTLGQYAVTKAPVTFDAGAKTGSLPRAGLFPQDIIPSITPDENSGVTKVEILWYFRGNNGDTNQLTQTNSMIYLDDSGENYRGRIYMTSGYKRDYPIGNTMDVLCKIRVFQGGNQICFFTVKGYQLTVTEADLSEAAVTVTNGDELVYGAPSGTAETRTLAFTVENAAGDTLTLGTDYTIRNNSNMAAEAGKHTLVLEGMGDYAGTLEYQWEIAPLTLGSLAEQNIIRKDYDGTADLPSDFIFTPSFLTNGSWYGLNDSDYTVEGSYDSAAAGENKTVTFQLTLTGENYRFSNGEKTMEVTISKDCNILQADAPAAQNGALTVTNQRKATYTYDVSALLPQLDGEKTYGDVRYSVYDVTLGQYYAASEQASIDANGLLTLPIQSIGTDAEGPVGKVRIWVESTNYQDFALTIDVSATNKIVPAGAPVLSGTTLSYGDKLSGITLSGTMRDGSKAVKGTFAWDNADAVMDKLGSYQAAWTFTPEDTDHYAAAQGTTELTVQPRDIAGAKITLGAELTYNGLRQTQRVTSVTVDGRDVTYTVSGDTAVNAGEYTLTVTGTDNYTGTAQAKWTIAKADAVLTAAPEAVDGLLHTGKAQALVTAGKASGGTLVYSLTENGVYTETIPTGSKVGSYTVWYKVEGDRNHNDTAAQSVTVAISKADDPVYAIGGAVRVISVSGEDEGAAAGAVVTVRKGTEQVGRSVTADSEGAFRMDPVRPGLYNVVAQYNGKTVTQMVEITDHAVKDLTITVFREDVSSTLEIKGSGELTEELVVGGLDKEAAAQFDENTSSVRMDLRVVEMPADKNDAVQKALRELAGGKELSFLDITPMLTRNGGTPEQISGTKTVLEIVISYNTSRKGITVLRYHNGAAQELTKLAALPTVPEDFTFYVDTVNQRIHIFTSQFSTYAIGYTGRSGGNGGNGGSASSAVSSGASTSPSTGDAGLLAYGIMALSSYTGTALLLRRRKRED